MTGGMAWQGHIKHGLWIHGLGTILGVCLGLVHTANASIIDRPSLKVEGVVIVWGADASSNTPIASEFITHNNGANQDLITGDAFTVVTGTLDAADASYANDTGAALRIQRIANGPDQVTTANGDRVTDASDSFTPFQLNNRTDVRTIRSEIETSFYVASNRAFNIDAVASTTGNPANLNLIRLRMRVTQAGNDAGLAFGASSQLPHTGNTTRSGVQHVNFRRLSTMTGGYNIFSGNRRTARAPGSITDQSVRFDQTYRWNTGNIDLSQGVIDVEAEVVYTVFIP